jgi:hypothetical protein
MWEVIRPMLADIPSHGSTLGYEPNSKGQWPEQQDYREDDADYHGRRSAGLMASAPGDRHGRRARRSDTFLRHPGTLEY